MRLPRLRFLIPFAIAVVLSMGASHGPLSQHAKDQRIARITWDAACRISEYQICPKNGPEVRRSPILGELASARGAYWLGSYVVWLDSPLNGTQQWLTTFHEQVHYIQQVNRVEAEGYDKTLRCLTEREALDFTNIYADELKRPSLKRTVEDWQKLYGCVPSTTKAAMGTH